MWISSAALVIRESVRAFTGAQHISDAAMLAYYGFLSLMPLLLIVVFLLGLFVQSSEAVLDAMDGLVAELFPSFNQAVLRELLGIAQQRVWGWVSLVLLLWSTMPFAGAMRSALLRVFRSETKVHFIKAKLLDAAAILVLLTLFVFLAAGKVLQPWLSRLPGVAPGDAVAVKSAVTFVIMLLVMMFVYRVFAPVRLSRGPLLAGSLTAAILLAVVRPLFGVFLRFNPDYGYAFGSLKAVFLVVVWAYVTFAILLFGACVAATVRRKEALVLRGLFMQDRTPKSVSPLLRRFTRSHDEGHVLFREGDPGHEMFYVVSGSVTLKRGSLTLKTVSGGEYFGEMSMLLDAPRTADAVIAAPQTLLAVVSRDNFDLILAENPRVVLRILKEMAARLRETDGKLLARHESGGA